MLDVPGLMNTKETKKLRSAVSFLWVCLHAFSV